MIAISIEIGVLVILTVFICKGIKDKMASIREYCQDKLLITIFAITFFCMFLVIIGYIMALKTNVFIAMPFVIIPIGLVLYIFAYKGRDSFPIIEQKTKKIATGKNIINIVLIGAATMTFTLACFFISMDSKIIAAAVLAMVTLAIDILNIFVFYKLRAKC